MSLEQTGPDGQVVESISSQGNVSVRLHLRIENLTDGTFFVAGCHGGLAIVPDGSPKPLCDAWLSLAPRGGIDLYPTIHVPTPASGTFTERLRPKSHAPVIDWPSYAPDPVSFELHPRAVVP